MKTKKIKSLLAITGLLLTFSAQAQESQAQEGIDAQTTVERCGFVITPTMGLRVSEVILLTDDSDLLDHLDILEENAPKTPSLTGSSALLPATKREKKRKSNLLNI